MTFLAIAIAGLFVATAAVSILTLAFCGRLFRAQKATLVRAAAVYGVQLVLSALALTFAHRGAGVAAVALGILASVQFLAMWLLIRWLLRTGSGKAALIMLTWLVGSAVPNVALALLWRATLAEAFVVPTGAMAPTIFGKHVDKTCPRCGYHFAVGASFRQEQPEMTAAATCTNCGTPVEILPNEPTVSGDRILVSKRETPRRWDLVVFPPPGDIPDLYVKRLVGLPGETIEIRGGDLYVDGRRLRKPSGTLHELWLPVHDTAFLPPGTPPPDGPGWVPQGDPPRWTWQTEQGWRFQGGPRQRGELRFSPPVTDRLAYNWQRRLAGGAADTMGTAGEVLVPDLEIVCQVAQVADSAVWGFVWAYRADWITASIAADGTATLAHSVGEPIQGAAASQDQAHVQVGLIPPLAGSTIRFAIRDGQAYLLQDRGVNAFLTLPDAPAGTADEDDARPSIGLFAEGGELQVSRIRLYRDVYYLTAAQVDPYGTPGISNPVTLAGDQYLVLGDNSRASRDGRFFGPISAHSVKGVVRCTYWPPHRIRSFVPPSLRERDASRPAK